MRYLIHVRLHPQLQRVYGINDAMEKRKIYYEKVRLHTETKNNAISSKRVPQTNTRSQVLNLVGQFSSKTNLYAQAHSYERKIKCFKLLY